MIKLKDIKLIKNKKKKSKYYPIGKVFNIKGKRFIAKKMENACEGCAFNEFEKDDSTYYKLCVNVQCSKYERKDNIDVIFIEV